MPSSVIPGKLARVRPPQVRLTYDVEVGGAIELRELPFVVGILADLTGQPQEPLPRPRDRKFVEIIQDNFDSVLVAMKPHLAFKVDNKLSEDPDAGMLLVDLYFKYMEDFEPYNVARQVKPLRELLELRWTLGDLRGTLGTNDRLEELLSDAYLNSETLKPFATRDDSADLARTQVLDEVVDRARIASDPDSKERHKNVIRVFLESIAAGQITISRDAQAMINRRIAEIDYLISMQLNEVMHHPCFQRLEGSWRALAYLVRNTETGPGLKIKVLNITKKEILRDLQRAPEFDQSVLFKKIHEEEFGVFGGQPYAVLIGDFEIGRASCRERV